MGSRFGGSPAFLIPICFICCSCLISSPETAARNSAARRLFSDKCKHGEILLDWMNAKNVKVATHTWFGLSSLPSDVLWCPYVWGFFPPQKGYYLPSSIYFLFFPKKLDFWILGEPGRMKATFPRFSQHSPAVATWPTSGQWGVTEVSPGICRVGACPHFLFCLPALWNVLSRLELGL